MIFLNNNDLHKEVECDEIPCIETLHEFLFNNKIFHVFVHKKILGNTGSVRIE
jgi:hypothetical protein